MIRVREKLGDKVLEMVTRTDDMLVVKLLVEGTGILAETHIDRVVARALELRNPWISETALRACRHLAKPSETLIANLRDYMDAIMPLEFWRRRGEFLFSLRLSDGFGELRRVCKLRLADMVSAVAGFVLLLLVDTVAVAYGCMSLAGVVVLERVTGRHIVSDKGVDWNLNLLMGRCLVVLLIGTVLISGNRTVTGSVLGIEWAVGAVTTAMGAVGACLVVPYYDLGRLVKYGRFGMRQIVMFLGQLVMMVGLFFGVIALAEWLGWDAEVVAQVVTIAGAVLGVGMIGVRALRNWTAWRRDKRRLKEVEVEGRWKRAQISAMMDRMGTARGRYGFVSMLERRGVRPEGTWAGGTVPSYGGDRASILLAELEERWLGLAR